MREERGTLEGVRFTTKFLLSATSAAQFPDEARTGGAPEIAFLGRSNVGKSSLINKLLGESAARVSSTPGRTRAINFFALHEGTGAKVKQRPSLVFADLPGYGYAKISKSISAEWSGFIDPYLTDREQLALCICLVDSNVPPQESDSQLLDFLRQIQRPHLVVATKSDRLSGNALAKSLKDLRQAHGEERIVPVSSKSENGVKALWPEIQSVLT